MSPLSTQKTPEERRQEIADGNDRLRKELVNTIQINSNHSSLINRVVLSSVIDQSPHREKILKAVASYNDFTMENDPYKEHYFGMVEVEGEKYCFRIDYYDKNFRMGVDPDVEEPHRLLTIYKANDR